MDLKRIPIISRAPTDFTGDIDIGKEIHFNFQHAVTMAGLAAAALYIKAEAAWFIAPNLGFIRRCKKGSDEIKGSRIGRRIGTRRPSNRTLIDINDLIDILDPHDPIMGKGALPSPHEFLGKAAVKDVIHKGTLAAAADTGHNGQGPQRNGDIDVFKVVGPCPFDYYFLAISFTADLGNRNLFPTAEIIACDRPFDLHDFLCCSLSNNLSPVFAGARSNIDDLVSCKHRIFIMFDNKEGVSQITKMLEGGKKFVIIPLVKADTRFIKDVEYTDKPGTNLCCKADPLGLAAGKSSRCPARVR